MKHGTTRREIELPITLNPYLNFHGNTRQAMEFYKQVFGGNLNLSTFREFQASSDPGEDEKILHARLEAPNGISFMASDTPNGMEYQPGTNFSMSLNGDDESELRGYFEKLADGGSVDTPLEKTPRGDVHHPQP
jgi:PhnB protein